MMGAVPPTSWTRQMVAAFLEEERPQGQRIVLPHGLATKGDDRSSLLERVFPNDLTDKSVLDVGCSLGFFCLEAHRRGAARTIGVESDPEKFEHAETIARMLGAPVEYRLLDLEDDPLPGPCDHVLFLNTLHQVRDPIAILDKLTSQTRERLVLEVTGPASKRPDQLLKRKGAGWLVRRKLPEMPLVVVGRNGTTGRKLEQKFYFTPGALEHLLLHQRAAFACCETFPAPDPDRFLLVAHKRRIGRLVLVTGPSACGKSTIIERLRRGEGGAIAAACDFDSAQGWEETDTTRVHNDGRVRVERLLYHYDMLRPWQRFSRVHRRAEGLDLLDCADRVQIVTLLVRTSVLRARVEDRLEHLKPDQPSRRRRLREVLRLYQRPERLARLIREWLAYCASRGVELILIDNSEEPPRRIAPDQWERLVLEG